MLPNCTVHSVKQDDSFSPSVQLQSTDTIDTMRAPVVQKAVSLNRSSHTLLLCGLVFAAFKLPAHAIAYGDPSGGLLFQMLTPLAAVLWGGWLIFAGSVRKRVGRLIGRFRSATLEGDGESVKSTSETD